MSPNRRAILQSALGKLRHIKPSAKPHPDSGAKHARASVRAIAQIARHFPPQKFGRDFEHYMEFFGNEQLRKINHTLEHNNREPMTRDEFREYIRKLYEDAKKILPIR